MLHLAEASKGGLGDVRELTPDEFEFWYASLIQLNKLKRKAQKDLQDQMARNGGKLPDETPAQQSLEEKRRILMEG